MVDEITLAIVAIIGGGISSIVTFFVQRYYRQHDETQTTRRILVNNYLLQLQSAVDDLVERLQTPPRHEQKYDDDTYSDVKEYFHLTVLYSLAKIFAFKRIFIADGIYPEMNLISPNLGNIVLKELKDIDRILVNIDKENDKKDFRYYDNVVLGEFVIIRINDRLQTCTYKEFKKNYFQENKEGTFQRNIQRVEIFIDSLLVEEESKRDFVSKLNDFGNMLSKKTDIVSPSPDEYDIT